MPRQDGIPTMSVFTSLALFCLIASVDTELIPVPEKPQNTDIHLRGEISPYCRNGKCAGVPYRVILQLYRGLFFTKEEIQRKLSKKKAYTRSKHQTQKRKWGLNILMRSTAHDGDRCCTTSCEFICFPTLTNTKGQPRIVVHFYDQQPDAMYQLILRGKCEPGGRCTNCLQEYTIYYILVVDERFQKYPPFEFDEFYMENYCSCKD